MKYFRHCNPVTKRCKCDFGYTPIAIETEKLKFEHICKVRKRSDFVAGNRIFLSIFKTIHISLNSLNRFQQATMAHTYHSDSFSAIHESTSYYPSNGTMQSRHNDKSLNEEKHKDMIIKHITSQLNSSIHGDLGYEYYPAAPYDFKNHSFSNKSRLGYPHNSGKQNLFHCDYQ